MFLTRLHLTQGNAHLCIL